MTFQIEGLRPDDFAAFFTMSEEELTRCNARKMVVAASPGTPCRVSLADAEVGETVVLVNYEHQPAKSPFRSSHAIFVRQGAEQARPAVGDVPTVMLSRLISLRLFGHDDMMVDADVVPGTELKSAIVRAFADPQVSYLHLHYAKPGCFAASVQRA